MGMYGLFIFKHEKAPTMAFTPDADFPVIYGEKGIIVFDLVQSLSSNTCSHIKLIDLKGGNAPNMVPDHAEATFEVDNIEEFESKFNNYMKDKDYPVEFQVEDKIVKVIAKGISAHGSTPEKGENAYILFNEVLAGIFRRPM